MTRKAEVLSALALLRELAADLPDGMWDEAAEIRASCMATNDWDSTAEEINMLCASWGYPHLLAEGD
jgi:hypothetical protein